MYFKIKSKDDKIEMIIEDNVYLINIHTALALRVELYKSIGESKKNQKILS